MFGGIIENELFSEVKKRGYFENHPGLDAYVNFRDSERFVKENQPWADPHRPNKFFPLSLIKLLETDSSLPKNGTISFYTAVGSHLDRWHGIDGFFEYSYEEDGHMKRVVATTDVTTNPHKDSHKADIIISVPKDGIDTTDPDYKDVVKKYGDMIKYELLTKISQSVNNRGRGTYNN